MGTHSLTSSIRAGFNEIDFIAASIDFEPIKVAEVRDKDPMKEPIGVLLAPTITTFFNDINCF